MSLYVSLPLLAAALKRFNQDSNKLESATAATLMSMVEDLALFSIRSDHHAHSRTAAASCLFSVLFQSSEDNEIGCASALQKLMEDVVSPVLTTALSCLEREVSDTPTPKASGGVEVSGKSLPSVFAKVEDTLSFMSVLVSHFFHITWVHCKEYHVKHRRLLCSLGFSSSMQRRLFLPNGRYDCVILNRTCVHRCFTLPF